MTHSRGFTLIEVMVALVIVAFGMGAVLSALTSSADNIAALREKTLAEWVAMNQIADVRLNLNAPQPGVTEGNIKAFGNADWHWRQDIVAMEEAPGVLEIAVRVQRLKPGSSSSSSKSSSTPAPKRSSASSSSGAPSSFFNSSSGSSGASSSGFGGSSSGLLGQLNSSSGAQLKNLGAAILPKTNDNEQWVATVIGFRGDALSPASGEAPDWTCSGGGNCGNSSSSSGASSSSGTTVPSSNNGSSSGGSSSGTIVNPTPTSGSSSGT